MILIHKGFTVVTADDNTLGSLFIISIDYNTIQLLT